MRLLWIVVLLYGVVFSVSSCATVPTEPPAPGELRLLKIDHPSSLVGSLQYEFVITFQTEGQPEIKRACFYWSTDGPYCFRVTSVEYESKKTFRVWANTIAFPGSYQLECYAEYIREGKTQRSNVVTSSILVTR